MSSTDGKVVIGVELDTSALGKSFKDLAASIDINKGNLKELKSRLKDVESEMANATPKAAKKLEAEQATIQNSIKTVSAAMKEQVAQYNAYLKAFKGAGAATNQSLGMSMANAGNINMPTLDLTELVSQGKVSSDVIEKLSTYMQELATATNSVSANEDKVVAQSSQVNEAFNENSARINEIKERYKELEADNAQLAVSMQKLILAYQSGKIPTSDYDAVREKLAQLIEYYANTELSMNDLNKEAQNLGASLNELGGYSIVGNVDAMSDATTLLNTKLSKLSGTQLTLAGLTTGLSESYDSALFSLKAEAAQLRANKTATSDLAKEEKLARGQITGVIGLLGMLDPRFTRLSYALRQFSKIGKVSFKDVQDSLISFGTKLKDIGNMNLVDGLKKGVDSAHPYIEQIMNLFKLDNIKSGESAEMLKSALQGAGEKASETSQIIGSKITGGLDKCISATKAFGKGMLSVKGAVLAVGVAIAGMVVSIKMVISATKKMYSAIRKAGSAFAKFYDFDEYFGSLDTMIEAYNDMSAKEAALEALMRSRMGATDETVKSIKDLISAEEEEGVVSKQNQTAALQQLSAYVTQSSTLETLLPVLNDYTMQMYGVNASEKESESAAKLFGKAMKGQTETLRRAGYVTEQQAQAIKNAGSETERAALLSQYMSERCGDMNRVLSQTNAGQQRKLANSMADVQREFGQAASVLKTTFMPVATAVLAVMARMASYAAALAQSLAKFFGRSTKAAFATATQIEDVATATENAGSAAKKAAKEASNSLGIDELNVLNQDSDASDGGSGSGGGGVVDPSTMAQDTSLIDNLSNSLDEMLAKLSSAYDLGLLFGTKMKEALASIPWEDIKEKASQAGTAIAQFFNGIIDSGLIEQLGTTLGEAVNTVTSFMNGFLDNFDFASLGTSIANSLENLITTIDWSALGHMFGQAFIGIFTTVNNFLESFNWSTIGVAIADFLCGINWLELLGQVVEFAINALALIFIDLPVTIINFLITVVNNVLTGIADYLDTTMNKEGVNIVEALLLGIVDALKTIVSWVWDHVAVPIISAVGKYFGVDSDYLHDLGTDAINGFFEGIKDIMKNAFSWIKEHIFDPIVNGVKKLFDIHSPSKVMMEIGVYVIKGMFEGMKGLWDLVKNIWESLKTNIINIVVNIISYASNKWDAFKSKLSEITTSIKNSLISIFKEIVEPVKKVFTDISSAVLDTWNSLWSGIKGVINSIITGIQSFVNGVISGINALISALNGLKVSPPKWVKDLTGVGDIGFNIPKVSSISIPKLATGAVLPANNPFLAVVGDQKQGTNVEAPLETIQDAVALVLAPYLEKIIYNTEKLYEKDTSVNIGDREIARANIRGQKLLGGTLRVQ